MKMRKYGTAWKRLPKNHPRRRASCLNRWWCRAMRNDTFRAELSDALEREQVRQIVKDWLRTEEPPK